MRYSDVVFRPDTVLIPSAMRLVLVLVKTSLMDLRNLQRNASLELLEFRISTATFLSQQMNACSS